MSFKVRVEPLGLSFTVAKGQSLLDAALEAKILLPYSCRSGSCSTCKAKVISGSFVAGTPPAQILMAEELEEGYSPRCELRPQTDMVIESPLAQGMPGVEVSKQPVTGVGVTPLIVEGCQGRLPLPPSPR